MSDGAISERFEAAAQDRAAAGWTWHLCALAAAVLLLGLGFAQDIRSAVYVWWVYPAYSHCFLILPISAWLVWEKKDFLKAHAPSVSPWLLLAAIPMTLFWAIGKFASITEVRQFAFVGFVEIFIAALLGWMIFRKLAFACLYLFFLVPTGQYLIPYLQEVTAKFVEVGLKLFSIPFFRDGLVFDLVNGRYEIAEACAGLRFLIATVALGVLFAHLIYRSKTKVAVFLASCFIFPVIGNGIRALVTVMVANYTNNRVAAGFDHIVYGWAFAVAIIMIILFTGSKFRDPELPPEAADDATAHRPRYGSLAGALAGIAVLLIILGGIARYADAGIGPADVGALDRVASASGWPATVSSTDWHVTLASSTARIERTFAPRTGADGARVDLAIYYYARGAGSPSMLNSRNHAWQTDAWHMIQHRDIRESIAGSSQPLDEYVIGADNDRRLVWVTYWLDGTYTNSLPLIRLLEFRSGLIHGHSAIVVLSTPINGSEAETHARLQGFLSSLGNLSAGLARAGRAASN